MSRIIVARHPNGESRLVVGWDHPAGGAFWTEYADYVAPDDDDGVLRCEGMWPGLSLSELLPSMPEDLRRFVPPYVVTLLEAHADDPNSGFLSVLDLSDAVKS